MVAAARMTHLMGQTMRGPAMEMAVRRLLGSLFLRTAQQAAEVATLPEGTGQQQAQGLLAALCHQVPPRPGHHLLATARGQERAGPARLQPTAAAVLAPQGALAVAAVAAAAAAVVMRSRGQGRGVRVEVGRRRRVAEEVAGRHNPHQQGQQQLQQLPLLLSLRVDSWMTGPMMAWRTSGSTSWPVSPVFGAASVPIDPCTSYMLLV